jgi:hypothetical protein
LCEKAGPRGRLPARWTRPFARTRSFAGPQRAPRPPFLIRRSHHARTRGRGQVSARWFTVFEPRTLATPTRRRRCRASDPPPRTLHPDHPVHHIHATPSPIGSAWRRMSFMHDAGHGVHGTPAWPMPRIHGWPSTSASPPLDDSPRQAFPCMPRTNGESLHRQNTVEGRNGPMSPRVCKSRFRLIRETSSSRRV